ncbi:metal ABC transporter substrate-binding protein [Micrococcoides hystricis]|uniref:Metal ABC transporter substrate-binding protein n=1 Tax=Micrococcoides hystricis TaxID=1572761 RepID=A0ABV6PDT3_9MICC
MSISRKPRSSSIARFGLLAGAAAFALTGCTQNADSGGENDTSTQGLTVVASTDVYQDLAERVLGEHGSATAIVTGAAQDPHSYEASPQDKLTLEKADVIVANGGGYDPFIDQLTEALGNEDKVIEAFKGESSHDHDHDHDHGDEDADKGADDHAEDDHAEDDHAHNDHAEDEHAHDDHAHDDETHDEDAHGEDAHDDHGGHDHEHGENEHVWYDLGLMAEFVTELGEEFGKVDPDNKDSYAANAEELSNQLTTMFEEVKAVNGSGEFLTTEPVAEYLLEDAGFDNATDPQFISAVEHDQDLPPVLLKEAEDQLSSKSVKFLAYNTQTETSQTKTLRAVAEENDIPVLYFTENLPEGQDYIEWMKSNIETVSQLKK